jgi:hypothetical protein
MLRHALTHRSLFVCAFALVLGVAVSAQSPAPGHRLYSNSSGTASFLVDDQGTTVHTWPSTFPVGNTLYIEDSGTLLRTIRTGVSGPGGGTGGGMQRLSLDGTELWRFEYDTGGNIHHHDVESMPNGNVILVAWELKTGAQAIAAGRNPAMVGSSFYPDHIVEVERTGPTTGSIVWEWHVWDHLIQDFDAGQANFGDPAMHPELLDINYPATSGSDFNHVNSVDYEPANDWIVISSNFQNEFWIIDHSTTTAEAAGHIGGDHGKGGDFLYRWGNPEAYRAGTVADKDLFRQHGVKFIPAGMPGAGNILLFNNQISPSSRVEEIVLPIDVQGEFIFGPGGVYGPSAPIWTYQDPGMQSNIMGSAIRLPNNNTLISSTLQGRIFEVTTAGQNIWEINPPPGTGGAFHATYYERSFWTDKREVSAFTPGDSLDFDLIAGSKYAGDTYVVLGSVNGSMPGLPLPGGLMLPLVFDWYTQLTFQMAGSAVFSDFIGVLDGQGRGTASLVVPPNLPASVIGMQLHHAFLITDAGFTVFKAVSNAENATFTM